MTGFTLMGRVDTERRQVAHAVTDNRMVPRTTTGRRIIEYPEHATDEQIADLYAEAARASLLDALRCRRIATAFAAAESSAPGSSPSPQRPVGPPSAEPASSPPPPSPPTPTRG